MLPYCHNNHRFSLFYFFRYFSSYVFYEIFCLCLLVIHAVKPTPSKGTLQFWVIKGLFLDSWTSIFQFIQMYSLFRCCGGFRLHRICINYIFYFIFCYLAFFLTTFCTLELKTCKLDPDCWFHSGPIFLFYFHHFCVECSALLMLTEIVFLFFIVEYSFYITHVFWFFSFAISAFSVCNLFFTIFF